MSVSTIRPTGLDTTAPGTKWVASQGGVNDQWQLIDNGVATPDDTQHIYALGVNFQTNFYCVPSTPIADGATIDDPVIGFRYQGSPLTLSPECLFEVWADYPTAKARKIGEKQVNLNTASAILNGQFTLTGETVTSDEWNTGLRIIPISKGAFIGGESGGPDPYDPPAG